MNNENKDMTKQLVDLSTENAELKNTIIDLKKQLAVNQALHEEAQKNKHITYTILNSYSGRVLVSTNNKDDIIADLNKRVMEKCDEIEKEYKNDLKYANDEIRSLEEKLQKTEKEFTEYKKGKHIDALKEELSDTLLDLKKELTSIRNFDFELKYDDNNKEAFVDMFNTKSLIKALFNRKSFDGILEKHWKEQWSEKQRKLYSLKHELDSVQSRISTAFNKYNANGPGLNELINYQLTNSW